MRPSPWRARLAHLGIYAGAFLGPFGGGVTVSMLPELGSDFGVSASAASLSVTAYLVPFAAIMLVSGTLGERVGRHRAVVGGYVLYIAASLLAVFATSFPLFLAARAVQGVANAFTTPLLLAVVAGVARPGGLGRALGWFGSLQAAGQTSAPLIGGVAAEFDWRYAFVGVALVAMVLAVVGLPPAPRSISGARPRLRSAWRASVVRAGLAAALAWGLVSGLAFLVALHAEDVFGLSASGRGLLLTTFGVAGILTARLVGSAVDRVGPRRCVIAGSVLGALVLAGVALVPTVWAAAVLWALGGVSAQLVLVGVNALVLGSSTTNLGGSTSVVQSFRFGAGALAPVVVTPIYHADPLLAFLGPALLVLVATPLVVPRPAGPDPRPAAP